MQGVEPGWLNAVGDEFRGAVLPDRRLEARVREAMEALAAKPGSPFPTAMGSSRALEGLYRLLNNPRVGHEHLFEAHAEHTAARTRSVGEVLVVHDTTTFKFPHLSPQEVGECNTGKAGFLGHVSLVLDGDLSRCPLGVAALQTIHRDPQRARRYMSGPECAKLAERESDRWLLGVQQAEQRLGQAGVVHVMDREGDSYALYAQLLLRGSRFVIRADDRTCLFDGENTWIRDALSRQQAVVERTVHMARRRNATTAPAAVRAERDARTARLAIAGCRVTLKRTKYLKDPVPPTISLNAVRVFELDPPPGVEPVEWLILTTEPIETEQQLQRIVDIYRCRWVIEEFFKALKTGCLYEERQLEQRESLLIALVMFLPIACQLLWLRSRARVQPEASAEGLIDELQLKIVRRFSDYKLPTQPTVRQLVWAIASMGGHLKNNGAPGWQTLARGWRRLLELEQGWRAALDSRNL
jgi:hypothetical protein